MHIVGMFILLQVAKKLLTGKMAMAAVGNLVHTPYLDELM